MARFNFKLQRVLQIRAYREKNLKGELAKLLRNYNREELVLGQLQKKMREYLTKWGEIQNKSHFVSVDEMRQYYEYLLVIEKEILQQKERLNQLLNDCNTLRTKLLETSKEKRILEKLKERQWQKFRTEMEHKDQEIINEIALEMYHRQPQT